METVYNDVRSGIIMELVAFAGANNAVKSRGLADDAFNGADNFVVLDSAVDKGARETPVSVALDIGIRFRVVLDGAII